MSRIDPQSREEAFFYQFEDDIKILKLTLVHGEQEFENILQMIEVHIKCYRSKKLRKMCKKAEEKTKARNEWMA